MLLLSSRGSSKVLTSTRSIGYLYLSSLKERQPYNPRELPKLFTEVYDPDNDSIGAHLE